MWTASRISSLFILVAALCWLIADTAIISAEPWDELARIGKGFILPSFIDGAILLDSLLSTLAFAVIGVVFSACLGLLLARFYHLRIVRLGCAFVRSVHELFWALLLLQLLGLQTLTGLLAIMIPFTGIFTKVFAEILEETDPRPAEFASQGQSLSSSGYLYAKLALAWPKLMAYFRYRFECAIRSSAILGFVGLPTLGFHLESFFREGDYAEAAGVLYCFFLLIATIRLWSHRYSLLALIVFSLAYLPLEITFNFTHFERFLLHEIVPVPLRGEQNWLDLHTWQNVLLWGQWLFSAQIQDSVVNTLVLSVIALVGSGLVALMSYPWVSRVFMSKLTYGIHFLVLVALRSLPEIMLAFIFAIMMGPSMLPAILALSLHNGAIIGHLLGQMSHELRLRSDHAQGVNLYLYEVTPRLYGSFLAFLFYRWEVILRESAILGILGVHTLGFYVDSAFEELRFDRALVLILVCAFLNMLVDSCSRFIRAKLRLKTMPEFTNS